MYWFIKFECVLKRCILNVTKKNASLLTAMSVLYLPGVPTALGVEGIVAGVFGGVPTAPLPGVVAPFRGVRGVRGI